MNIVRSNCYIQFFLYHTLVIYFYINIMLFHFLENNRQIVVKNICHAAVSVPQAGAGVLL